MGDAYKTALAIARFLAALNLVAGAALLVAFALMLALPLLPFPGPNIIGFAVTILTYGAIYLVIGIGMLICAKWIARFAVRVLNQ